MPTCKVIFSCEALLLSERREAKDEDERMQTGLVLAKHLFACGSREGLREALPLGIHRLPYLISTNSELALSFSQLLLDQLDHSYDLQVLMFHVKSLRRRMARALEVVCGSNTVDHANGQNGEDRRHICVNINIISGIQRLVYNVSIALASDAARRNLEDAVNKRVVRSLCYFCKSLAPFFISPYHMNEWCAEEMLAYVLESEAPANEWVSNPMSDAMQILSIGIFKDVEKEEFPLVWSVAMAALDASKTPLRSSRPFGPVKMDSSPPTPPTSPPPLDQSCLKRKLPI